MKQTKRKGMVKRPIFNSFEIYAIAVLIVIAFSICVSLLLSNYEHKYKDIILTTPLKTTTSILRSAKVSLTVYNATRKEGGVCYPTCYNGENINNCIGKCCSISKEALQRLNIHINDSIFVKSDYAILDGWFRIIDVGKGYNTVELIVPKTPKISIKFHITNQTIYFK